MPRMKAPAGPHRRRVASRDPVFCYVTCADAAQAERIGAALVGERLAACVNIIPGMRSIYRWQGAVERAEETVLLVKTGADRVPAVVARVRALHSYTVPCVAVLPVIGGNPDYLAWLATESRPERRPRGTRRR